MLAVLYGSRERACGYLLPLAVAAHKGMMLSPRESAAALETGLNSQCPAHPPMAGLGTHIRDFTSM